MLRYQLRGKVLRTVVAHRIITATDIEAVFSPAYTVARVAVQRFGSVLIQEQLLAAVFQKAAGKIRPPQSADDILEAIGRTRGKIQFRDGHRRRGRQSVRMPLLDDPIHELRL